MSGHEASHDQIENVFFFTDPYGEKPHHEPVIETVSDLDSSEDEVIFSGRQNAQTRPPAATATATAATVAPVVVTVLDDDIQFLPQPTLDRKPESEWDASRDAEKEQDSFISLSTKKKKRPRNRRKDKRSRQSDENIIFSDYVRNVTRQDRSPDPCSDEEQPRFGLGLSSKDKAKFRELSTLDTVDESEVLAREEFADAISDEDEDEDDSDSDSDDSSSLEELLSHIRRGASFTMMDEAWDSEMLDDVDFDIIDMQQDGPLKKKKKKRKPLDFGLSDSEMELQLQETHEKDRTKKAAKKRERERLRAEGLLGKKKKKPDRRSKDTAFGIDELKVELKSFLQTDSDWYSFIQTRFI
jgi:hypothetical protein